MQNISTDQISTQTIEKCTAIAQKKVSSLVNLQPLLAQSQLFLYNSCVAIESDYYKALIDKEFLTGGLIKGAQPELIAFIRGTFTNSPFQVHFEQAYTQWLLADYSALSTSALYDLRLVRETGRSEYAIYGPKGLPIGRLRFNNEMEQFCASLVTGDTNGATCDFVFKEIERVSLVQNQYFREVEGQLASKNAVAAVNAWESFSEKGRFMTFFDIALTSWVYRDQFSNGDRIPLPPKYQFFTLRPSVVYEHLSSALAGERTELTMAVEWLGINNWNAQLPVGLSVASIYADRATGKSVGHGVMLHLYNTFSIGVANRGGGDNSIFINVDLLEWLNPSQDKYAAFRPNIDK